MSLPITLGVNDPDDALVQGLWLLKTSGEVNQSRNGRVLVAPGPVVTTYRHPRNRVIFNPVRDANPFFHLFESLWMLAGRNDVAKVSNYAKQMESFADDGLQWGAYGYRWRHFFGFDQLLEVIDLLKTDPKTRRAVVTMWSPVGDMVAKDVLTHTAHMTIEEKRGGRAAKDVPCNTQIYFDLTRGRLDMTVTNRSNDIVWGAYGANVVHMSMLHEYVAAALGAPLGLYHQFSNNYHAYIDRPDVQRLIDASTPHAAQWEIKIGSPGLGYGYGMNPMPLVGREGADVWLRECEYFVEDWTDSFASPFLANTAAPMMQAHAEYKAGHYHSAALTAQRVEAPDWRVAAEVWLTNRAAARALKETK